jgi:DNA-binding MarR family transcriptional regulator
LTYANYIRHDVADTSDSHDPTRLATEVRLVVGRLARRLRQESAGGLTPSQLSVLASVDRLGPIQLGDLARVEAVAPPTLTRAVDRLEEQGIVTRQPDPVDGRAVLVDITPTGRAALEDVRTARVAFLAKGLAELTEDERLVVADAVRLLNTLLAERSPLR